LNIVVVERGEISVVDLAVLNDLAGYRSHDAKMALDT
jgi:hypothetical protein